MINVIEPTQKVYKVCSNIVGIGNRGDKKMTSILKFIKWVNDTHKRGARKKEIVQFYHRWVKFRSGYPSHLGYYSTALSNCIDNGVLSNNGGAYTLTSYGRKNIHHPYKMSPSQKLKHEEWKVRRHMYNVERELNYRIRLQKEHFLRKNHPNAMTIDEVIYALRNLTLNCGISGDTILKISSDEEGNSFGDFMVDTPTKTPIHSKFKMEHNINVVGIYPTNRQLPEDFIVWTPKTKSN